MADYERCQLRYSFTSEDQSNHERQYDAEKGHCELGSKMICITRMSEFVDREEDEYDKSNYTTRRVKYERMLIVALLTR